MKKLSILFGVSAILLSDAMCAVVAYMYCHMQWLCDCGGTSAPASLAFLYAIPFLIGIAVCSMLSVMLWKKQDTQ